jgi:tetratricopeptide (TPR) repeat protein
LGLFMLIGSLLLVTPFVVGFSQSGEKTIFSAMATLTDVKETLESKRDLLKEIGVQVKGLSGEKRLEKIAVARKHFEYATDVHRLAENYLQASSRRHPKYATFWKKYQRTLDELWGEIQRGQDALSSVAPASVVKKAGSRRVTGRVVPAAAQAVPSRPASRATSRKMTRGDVLARYRDAYRSFARGGKKDLEESRSTFEKILEVEPDFHLARYWLARTYLLQDQVGQARKQAERLLRDQPNLQIAKDLIRDVADIQSLRQPTGVPGKVVVAAVPPVSRQLAKPQVPPVAPYRKVRKPVTQRVSPQPAAKVVPSKPSVRKLVVAKPVVARSVAIKKKISGKKSTRVTSTRASARVARQLAALPRLSTPARGQKAPRPIAVMIENSRFARPQSGLLAADIVYEMPVEGGITRFMALYLDQARKVAEVGPVRSARHYFVHQMPALDGIYAHCGGSTQGYAAIKKDGVDDIDEIRTGTGFWRNKRRKAPHNLYTKLGNLVKLSKKKGFRLDRSHPVEILPVMQVSKAAKVDSYQDIVLPYYSRYKVRYTYDPVTNTYARFINDKPHRDALADRQIAVENVVTVKSAMRKIDDYGRLDLELFGRGEATVFRGGEKIDAVWVRQGKESLLEIRNRHGDLVQMNPGRTWIHMIQPNRKITLATRPLPPQALKQLAQRRRSATFKPQTQVAPRVNMKLAKMSASQGVQGIISGSGPTRYAPRSPRKRGISGTVIPVLPPRVAVPRTSVVPRKAASSRALPPKLVAPTGSPSKPPVKRSAAPKVQSSVPKVSRSVERKPARAESPPRLAAMVLGRPDFDKGPTAAEVPEALRPLPHRAGAKAPAARTAKAAAPKANTWKNGSGTVYDLADFSLDSF